MKVEIKWKTNRLLSFILVIVMAVAMMAATLTVVSAEEIIANGKCGSDTVWTLYSDGTLVISGTGTMDEPIIPIWAPWYSYASKVKNVIIEQGVTSIGRFAFSDCGNLVSIVIPESIIEISWQVFYNSHNLKDVYYCGSEDEWNKISVGDFNTYLYQATIHYNSTGPDNESDAAEIVANGECGANGSNATWTLDSEGTLTISGTGAMKDYTIISDQHTDAPWFSWKSNVKSIAINEGITIIGTWAFGYCDRATKATMPNSVAHINDYAFDGCESLNSIEIPVSVITMGNGVFYDCKNLISISIPKNVISIGILSFSSWGGAARITDIFVDENNPSYISVDGQLLNNDRTEFICYPAGRTDKSCKIPNGVASIGEYAFFYCDNIESIKIPKSVKTIEQGALYYCERLADIYYAGTPAEWKEIQINSYNDSLHSATIHYNSIGADDEPIVDLEVLMRTDPAVYNNELAEVAARLSLKTYDNDCKNADSVEGYLQYNLGFDKANIHSRNYGNDYAFTIATKEYSGDDADEILVIVAQGTTTIGEGIKDYVSKLDYNNERFYGGYAPYQVVSAFYSEIVSHDYSNPTSLYSLTEQDTRYKILVTGHSLGGATANLLAAQLTARRHIGGAIGQSDVFCYTFGAIDAIRVDSPIVIGYENIHNIYNELDTLSPTQYGRSFIGKNGIFLRNGKFGVIESFEHEYRTPEEKSNGNQLIASVNHAMHNYLEAVISERVKNSTLRPGNAGVVDLVNSYSVVGCPVDVDVYCDGELVGRVINNVVDDSATSISIFVDDDVKFIVYPDNKQYDLKITAFDEGTMVYYTQSLTGEMLVKTISNVALTKGKNMTSQIGGNIAISDVKLYVVNDDGEVLTEVLEDGTETPVKYTITVTDGTATPSKAKAGDTVTVTADTKSSYTFNEWSVMGGTVTLEDKTEATTTFTMPAENVAIKATYTKDAAPTSNPTPGSNDDTEVAAKQNSILMPLIVGIGSIALIGLVVFLLWMRKKHHAHRQ